MKEWVKGNKRPIIIAYEIIMLTLISLSLLTVFLSENPHPIFGVINTVVWVIFLIDVSARLIRAVSRWKYIKSNPFDIISVIPLEDILLLARFARVIKMFRYKNLIKRYLGKLDAFVQKYRLIRITKYTLGLLIVVSIILMVTPTFSVIESIIWVARNFAQFNYFPDVTETSGVLIVLSVILKVIGLLYMGILLSHISHIGLRYYEKIKDKYFNKDGKESDDEKEQEQDYTVKTEERGQE